MMAEQPKRSNPVRVCIVIGSTILWCGIICARLVQLQVIRHDDYAQQALQHQRVRSSILAPRGVIYDAQMYELAKSVSVSTVNAEPGRISRSRDLKTAARELASVLELDPDELLSQMMDPAHQTFMVVKRRIDPKDEARVEALGIDGVYLVAESMRVYPNLELACQVLGFVNMNGDGGAGVELQYDRELKGEPGQVSFDVDARRKPFRGRVEKAPVQGHALVLSIDKFIQDIAERELVSGVENASAARGTAIVMESDTGRILALAAYPSYNCNAYNNYSPDFWRDRAVSDYFEPGSTFKVVVASAALDSGLTRPDELIDCQMGVLKVSNHVFHDHKSYGLLTFTQVLENSSNIGAAKLGLRLGDQRLYDALHTFGFGAKTGVDLPGEIVGMVRDVHQWSGLSVAAISFGQEVGVTSVQILTAINAIANGGFRVRPSVVDRIISQDGNLVKVNERESVRIMRPETAAAVRDAFEGVVLRGTGKKAALEGYRAAGKTGTAQKIVNGQYSNTKYVASFIGFAPLPRPRITVLVQIDEPKSGIYGGDISAPIFRAITQRALSLLQVPPDQTVPVKPLKPASAIAVDAEDFRPNATPVPPVAQAAGMVTTGLSDTITVRVATANVAVPDFYGQSKRTAIELCRDLGLKIQTTGSGSAVSQLPPAGTLVPVGETCAVTFALNRKQASKMPDASPNDSVSAVRHTASNKR